MGALRIANWSVTPSRGRTNATISFTATQDAAFAVRVLGVTGGPIRTLVSRSASAGHATMVNWDYKDGKGVSVPAGVYTIEIRATTTDGQNARVVIPHTVTR